MTDAADADEVETFDTFEEALAAAMIDVPDGQSVIIHGTECDLDETDECTCEPVVHVVRRASA